MLRFVKNNKAFTHAAREKKNSDSEKKGRLTENGERVRDSISFSN